MNGVHLLELHELLVGALPVVAQCVNVLACVYEKIEGRTRESGRRAEVSDWSLEKNAQLDPRVLGNI